MRRLETQARVHPQSLSHWVTSFESIDALGFDPDFRLLGGMLLNSLFACSAGSQTGRSYTSLVLGILMGCFIIAGVAVGIFMCTSGRRC
jgi:hypothetical protein